MSSFEEKYRRKAPAEAAPMASEQAVPVVVETPAIDVLKAAAREEYKAANTSAHPEFELWVRVNDANENAQVSIPYSRRNHMITDGNGFVVSMHFDTPIISVTLQGRNLHDLFRKLMKHEVEWVMEFDARKWETPADNEPCITGIQIKRKPLPDNDRMPGEKPEAEKPATH